MQYRKLLSATFLIFFLSSISYPLKAQPKDQNLTIENYYHVKWGFANEFIDLWKKNHYPLLKKLVEKGDILNIKAEKPMMHSGEDTRWDFRVTIVYKNVAAGLASGTTDTYKKELYPDLEKLAKDEQHRFELLLAHWDIMVEKTDLNK